MHVNPIDFDKDMKSKCVKSLENAFGDDILEDNIKNNFLTHNGDAGRKWDYLNRNLARELGYIDCTIEQTHRGPWEMLIIYDHKTKCIITFMREERFADLKKGLHNRNKMHYADMLSKTFNSKLEPENEQLSFQEHKFNDEDNIKENVKALLGNLADESTIIKNHVMVLFDVVGSRLVHVRAVMVTPNLEIAKDSEDDWSRYISATESIVVEKVNEKAPLNNPTKGLKLKKKAIERQSNVKNIGIQSNESEKNEIK